MHTPALASLVLLAAPAVLAGHTTGASHQGFVKMKRGGGTIHLVGDQTVAKWSGGSAPAAPAIVSVAQTTGTTYTNILDSINAGLGIPASLLGKQTTTAAVTSSSSSSASSSKATSSSQAISLGAVGLRVKAGYGVTNGATTTTKASSSSASASTAAPTGDASQEDESALQARSLDLSGIPFDMNAEDLIVLEKRSVTKGAVSSSQSSTSPSSTSKSSSSSSSPASSSASSPTSSSSASTSSSSSAAASTTTSSSALPVSVADQSTAQGWGAAFANKYTTLSVNNHAVSGASARSFYRSLWTSTLASVKSGDYVIVEFGHLDNLVPGSIADSNAGCVGSTSGYGTMTTQVTSCDGSSETVYTYNVYLQKMCKDVQAKGATCIISSMTPKNEWRRDNTLTYVSPLPLYAKQAAAAAGAIYVPHEEVSVKKFIGIGADSAPLYFMPNDTLQPNVGGADAFAAAFASALSCAGVSSLTSSFTTLAKAQAGLFC